VPTDATNLVVTAIAHTFAHYGVELPGLHLVAHNVIPHGRGLGSSGAAIVSGVMAAKGLLEGIVEIDADGLLARATELEGHPDNVAPALFGGLTIAWTTPEGPGAKKLIVHRGVSPLICVPESTMSTKLARSLAPASVPHEDAIFNVSRSALLVAALTQSPELLLAATEDRLHQDYREPAMPATLDLLRSLRADGLAAVVSGAGPTVLVLTDSERQAEVAGRVPVGWAPLVVDIDHCGARVEHPAQAVPGSALMS